MAKKTRTTEPQAEADNELPDTRDAPASVGIEAPSDGGILRRANYQLDNLIGEVADDMLADRKAAHHGKEWALLKRDEQAELIEAYKARAETLVARVIDALAVRGFPTFVATVASYSGKMGARTVKLAVEVPAENFDPERLHGNAFLVFASAAEYGRETLTRPQEDQPALLEGGGQIDLTTGEVTGDEPTPPEGATPSM